MPVNEFAGNAAQKNIPHFRACEGTHLSLSSEGLFRSAGPSEALPPVRLPPTPPRSAAFASIPSASPPSHRLIRSRPFPRPPSRSSAFPQTPSQPARYSPASPGSARLSPATLPPVPPLPAFHCPVPANCRSASTGLWSDQGRDIFRHWTTLNFGEGRI